LYLHQSFSSEDDPISWVALMSNDDATPIQQLRPTGLFSNTIHISLFQIIFWLLLLIYDYNKSIYFLFGIFLALLGSTTAMIFGGVIILSAFVSANFLFAVLGWFVAMFLYSYFLPTVFDVNYSFFEIVRSLEVRFDSNLNNSMIQALGLFEFEEWMLYFVVLGLLFAVVLLLHLGFAGFLYSLLLCFGVFVPLILHPIILDIKYAFLYGIVSGQFSFEIFQSHRAPKIAAD
jgi:hypothetical protein